MARSVGWDIGGANLKCAATDQSAAQVEFPLWQRPHDLSAALRGLYQQLPPGQDRFWGVTMTGELADCFATKQAGVAHIVQSLVAIAPVAVVVYGQSLAGGAYVWFSPTEAERQVRAIAAANWHALAQLASTWLASPSGLLVDMGSTTTDLIPLATTGSVARGQTDTERLQQGELLYMGVVRTPIATLVDRLPYRGELCPLARELFATTLDAYLILGDLAEQPDRCDSADGRPWTRANAQARLARMFCVDPCDFTRSDAELCAQAISDCQLELLVDAIQRLDHCVGCAGDPLIVSGEGEFIVRRAAAQLGGQRDIVSLAQRLGPNLSRVAPAYAVACLLDRDYRSGTPSQALPSGPSRAPSVDQSQ